MFHDVEGVHSAIIEAKEKNERVQDVVHLVKITIILDEDLVKVSDLCANDFKLEDGELVVDVDFLEGVSVYF